MQNWHLSDLYAFDPHLSCLSISDLLPTSKSEISLHNKRPDKCGSNARSDDSGKEGGHKVDTVVVQQGQTSDVFHVGARTLYNSVKFTAVPCKHTHKQTL